MPDGCQVKSEPENVKGVSKTQRGITLQIASYVPHTDCFENVSKYHMHYIEIHMYTLYI